MNVRLELTLVMIMLPVLTQMVVMTVYVMLDTLVMDSHVQVNYINSTIYVITLNKRFLFSLLYHI